MANIDAQITTGRDVSVQGIFRLRVLLFAALALASVLSLLALPSLDWRLNARELIPAGGVPERVQAAEAVFGLSDTMTVGFVPESGNVFAPEALTVVRDLSARLAAIPGVAHLTSLATVPQVAIDGGVLKVAPLLAEADVDGALGTRLAAEIGAAGQDNGLLVSRDHAATMLQMQLAPGADAEAVIASVQAMLGGRPDMVLTGARLAQAELGRALIRDLALFLPAMALILGALLLALYRHPLPVLVILGKLMVTTLLTAGVMAGLDIAVYVPTLILPVVILVIAVSDDIYVIDHCLAKLREDPALPWQDAIAAAMRRAVPAVTFSALTTSGGLLALMLTALTAYSDFALAGAIGIGLSYVLTLTLLPACLSLVRRPLALAAQARRARVQGGMAGLWRRRPRGRRLAMALSAVLLALGLVAVPRLTINDSWLANLPVDSAVRQADGVLSRHVAGTVQMALLVEDLAGGSLLDDAVAARVFAAERVLSEAKGVGAVQGVFDDILRTNAALSGQDFGPYADARRAQGLLPGELVQGDIVVRTFRRYPLAPRLTADGRMGLATLYLTGADYASVKALLDGPVAAVNGSDLGLRLTPYGEAWDGFRAIDLVTEGFPRTLIAALAITFLLAALLFRSLTAAFLVFLPTLCTILLLHGFLVVTGTSLGIATAMFAAIAIGASIDYAIHLLVAYRNALKVLPPAQALDAALALTAPATVSAALAVVGGISVLLLSKVPPNLDLGLLICASLILSAALSLTLIPAFLDGSMKRRDA
ncbi:efflux RND transporter permease subunit [Tropicibacter sp. S64]|uniref:efflux RND transporter permease subunit n=1 Tax=Tropicibacter sp. S64 TaxID=3415122 RepID=UPI003C7D2E71